MPDHCCITDTHFACTRCQFEHSRLEPPNRLFYHLPDGREAHGFSTLGWCNNCRLIRDIEDLDTSRTEEASATRYRFAQARAEELAALPTDWLQRFRRRHQRRHLDAARTDLESEGEKLKAHAEVVRGRNSGPRCLECGSEETAALSFDGEDGVDTSFEHQCGGHLRMLDTEPGILAHVDIREMVLSPEGEVLERRD
jgi:hypothetical protein